MFKRILLTAVLGGGLLFTVPQTAQADHKAKSESRDRKDHWGARMPGYQGYYGGYGRGDTQPFWHFRGFDKHPDLYWYPVGYGNGAGYLNNGYYGAPVLTDVFGDDYYFAYGYRCNGYRDGYYYGADGAPISYYGRPFQRRNADCENYYQRHGYWYGTSDCSRFEVEKGYCDDYDRH
jgi:hypothetical protein